MLAESLAATRNLGVHMSQGEIICMLDDDDAFLPRKIEKQVARMQPGHGYEHCAALRKTALRHGVCCCKLTYSICHRRNTFKYDICATDAFTGPVVYDPYLFNGKARPQKHKPKARPTMDPRVAIALEAARAAQARVAQLPHTCALSDSIHASPHTRPFVVHAAQTCWPDKCAYEASEQGLDVRNAPVSLTGGRVPPTSVLHHCCTIVPCVRCRPPRYNGEKYKEFLTQVHLTLQPSPPPTASILTSATWAHVTHATGVVNE